MDRIARVLASLGVVGLLAGGAAALPLEPTQRRRAPARKPAAPALTTAPANVKCAEMLGTGVKTASTYCFVLAGRDPAQGVVVTIPPHRGAATLIFDLHNRHTYSEEEMKAGRGFARYTAVIGVLTLDGKLIGRAAVQSEFRSVGDLHDRISGGAGPRGVKAVAPIGRERVAIEIPDGVTQVSLLGEVLDALTAAGRETATPGRPVAIVSNVQVEYRPAPARRR
jgi:hypothetical protein